MLFVRDVPGSVAWYKTLLGADNDRGGNRYDRIVRNGSILLRLHSVDTDRHPAVVSPNDGIAGRGVLLFVRVSDLDDVHRRALDLGAEIVQPPYQNEEARHIAFTLRDPDGYALTIFQPLRSPLE
jgi:predicted enzyme related to lactoylglutathione lyase